MAGKLFGNHNGMPYLLRQPTVPEFRQMVKDGRVKVVVKWSLGEIACSSEDGSYDGLNDKVDALVQPDEWGTGLSDINYKAVGVMPPDEAEDTGYVLVEVDAEVDEMDEGDDE